MKRLVLILGSVIVLGLLPPSAEAKGKVPKKPKVYVNPGYVHKSVGLIPGHRYRIDVTAKGHVKFVAMGFQDVSWIKRAHVGSMTKPLQFSGTTPRSIALTPPVTENLQSWIVGLTVQDADSRPLQVRFVDLGKKK